MGKILSVVWRILRYALMAVSLLAVFLTLCFLIYAVSLRTYWRDQRTAINQDYAQAYEYGAFMEYQGNCLEMSEADLSYFYRYLYSPDTAIFRKGTRSAQEDSIVILLPTSKLIFSPMEDGERVHLQWEREGKVTGYYLSGHVSYAYMERYFTNALHQREP